MGSMHGKGTKEQTLELGPTTVGKERGEEQKLLSREDRGKKKTMSSKKKISKGETKPATIADWK